MKTPPTCVTPKGCFVFGIHKPSFTVENYRAGDGVEQLGAKGDGNAIDNCRNYPPGRVVETDAPWIYEIPNPFPFRGVTFIKKDWADARAKNPSSIRLPARRESSLSESLATILGNKDPESLAAAFAGLPHAMLLAAATTSTDPADLVRLAEISCAIIHDPVSHEPTGILFQDRPGREPSPEVFDHALFEALVNNPFLPDSYKNIMVLKPGIQGGSEIVGEYTSTGGGGNHVFEYLRRNSYIGWGHYAANMANDAVRYAISDLDRKDMTGLRHLYYQRTYCRLAEDLGLTPEIPQLPMPESALEDLRLEILRTIADKGAGTFTATLWGWNFGFDFAPSGYRLHASHQQIHQQYALVPALIADQNQTDFKPFSCGDLIADFCTAFLKATGKFFFACYLEAIRSNSRTDGRQDLPASLIVFEDEHVILFVPKAQTSQWELQLMCLQETGNILECNTATRSSLDRGILAAQKTLAGMGAGMVTTIEYAKRLDSNDSDQRLLYSFLPKLPESPGAFSEAQLRFINGHYPEDFAEACRLSLNRNPS
ncbi:MAG: hypothetical protein KKG47_03935 [Proteobacteria bacterium]|nr:hypothetical protein [Pseudomonadota bacterium]MBU1738096.1 hypothetical protein [Pseudomonadota bacterium]